MRNIVASGLIALAGGFFAPQMAWSQSSFIYVSNLGQPAIGSSAVGTDAWEAEAFMTGNNPSGYAFNSIQLSMAAASGVPDNFMVTIYSRGLPSTLLPGASIATLNGPTDPLTAGTYTYTARGLDLSPSTYYFVVLSAATPIATGAFAYNIDNAYPSATGGWTTSAIYLSDNGIVWNPASDYFQFAITATAVPEPGEGTLLGVSGALFFACYRRRGIRKFV